MFNIRYIYDGSTDGMLCCIAQWMQDGVVPADIVPEQQAQPTFFEEKYILTDAERAGRVRRAVSQKISPQALGLLEQAMLCCVQGKERLMLDFVRLGFHYGARVTALLGNAVVDALHKAVQALRRESHQYLGFVRFSDQGGVLCAVIEPKNAVLPLIAEHFCKRFPRERFMIYDQTHGQALLHEEGRCRLVALEGWTPEAAGKQEQQYRALWKLFYDTVAVAERENPRCRMSHMPRRYWNHLTEMQLQSDHFSLPA